MVGGSSCDQLKLPHIAYGENHYHYCYVNQKNNNSVIKTNCYDKLVLNTFSHKLTILIGTALYTNLCNIITVKVNSHVIIRYLYNLIGTVLYTNLCNIITVKVNSHLIIRYLYNLIGTVLYTNLCNIITVKVKSHVIIRYLYNFHQADTCQPSFSRSIFK